MMNSRNNKIIKEAPVSLFLPAKKNINLFQVIKGIALFCLLLLFAEACNYQNDKPIKKIKDDGFVKSIYSTILNEEKKILVYIPDNDSTFSIAESPVIYVLNDELLFSSVVEMIQLFNDGHGKGTLPKMVVIGINSTDKLRDFTPSHDPRPSESSLYPINQDSSNTSGGASKYALFIKNELIPFIDSSFHTSPNRILIGHSIAGLMTVNTLLNYTDLFKGYIAIDPSIWWNHQEIIKQAVILQGTKKFENIAFFYANSNISKLIADTLKNPLVRNPYLYELEFGGSFIKNLPDFYWIHYERESHESIPLIATFDGLQMMVNFFNKNIYHKHLLKSYIHKNNERNSAAISKLFNKLDFISINSKKYSKDHNLYMLYRDGDHTSVNLYYIMGKMFDLNGDTVRAKKNLEKSVSLKPENIVFRFIRKMKKVFKTL